jgi:benzoyl-CoA reductase/2-hydroxyglutaryl-CoA dehydratase subunit BcrC/BadD/HgdB
MACFPMRAATLDRFETLREENVLRLLETKRRGIPVVGLYCLYSPAELVVAAGAVAVSLCGTRQETIPAAEQFLPRSICPLVKSSFGAAVSDSCPFFHFADLLVAETTCDGKKKMYELLGEMKPLHLLQLPQTQAGDDALAYWHRELERLRLRLQAELGVVIDDDRLRYAIRLLNRERRALKALQDVCRANPSPISGRDLLTALHGRNFCLDREEGIALLEGLTAELQEFAARGVSPFVAGTPRILLTGVPIGVGSDKVLRLLEESGASVVCLESCGAYKKVELVDEEGDPLDALARRYLQIPCSCMSPNSGRLELVARLAREFAVDGVVDLTWQGCHTYNIESFALKRHLQRETGIPFLQLETDYSPSDTEQLKVRIEAFLELL